MRKLISCILIFAMLFSSAYAVSIDDAGTGYNHTTKWMRIEGTATNANQPVKLEVLTRNKTFTAAATFADVIYINQVNSGADKKFAFDVYQPAAGVYAYRLTELGNATPVLGSFTTYTDATVDAAITAYITDPARTTTQLQQLIDDYYPKFNIDYPLYTSLKASLGTALTTINSTAYADVPAFKLDLALQIDLGILNLQTAASEKVKYLDLYKTVFGIDADPIYLEFAALDTAVKETIAAKFPNNFTKANMLALIKNYYVLNLINNAVWNTVKPVLEKYLGINVVAIFANTTSEQYQQAMGALKTQVANGTIADISTIQSYLTTYVANLPAPEPPKDYSSSSSSSSFGGSYSVSGPSKPVETTPVIPPEEPKKENNVSPFDDLESVEWAKDAIENLYAQGIINGVGDKEFNPDGNVKREEFVKMLIITMGLEDKTAECSFDDVIEGEWYYEYIAAAYEKGIANGISQSEFGVGIDITREDMATLAAKAFEKIGFELKAEKELSFADKDDIAEYALTSIAFLNELGVLNGNTNNQVSPKKPLTRAEAAVFIDNILEIVEKLG